MHPPAPVQALLVAAPSPDRDTAQNVLERRGLVVAAAETLDQGRSIHAERGCGLVIVHRDAVVSAGPAALDALRTAHPGEQPFVLLMLERAHAGDLPELVGNLVDDYLELPVAAGLLDARLAVVDARVGAKRALRRNEDKFRSLVRNIPGTVYRCHYDAGWTMRYISENVLELTGYPASDFLGEAVRTYASIMCEDDLAWVDEAVGQALEQDRPFSLEYRIIRSDGAMRWVNSRGRGIRDANGELAFLDGALFDVTDRKRADDRIHAQQIQLEKQNSELRALNIELERRVVAQAIAHERLRSRRKDPAAVDADSAATLTGELLLFAVELVGASELVGAVESDELLSLLSAFTAEVRAVGAIFGATLESSAGAIVVGSLGPAGARAEQRSAERFFATLRQRLDAWIATARQVPRGGALALRVVAHSGHGLVGLLRGDTSQLLALGAVADELRTLLRAAAPGHLSCSESAWRSVFPDREPARAVRVSSAGVGLIEVEPFASGTSTGSSGDTVVDETVTAAGAVVAAAVPDAAEERYQLERALGHGMSGSVFAARDRVLDMRVGLKVLAPAYMTDAGRRQRVYKEVRIARMVTHNNVAKVYDLHESERGTTISMELIEGETLETRMRRTRLAIDDCVGIVRQIASGLAAIHAVGVVHRDLKPANIMIESGGRVVIVDFGVAHAHAPDDMRVTQDGGIVGTPVYMAMEQILGKPVDHRADLYSLGAVAYELLVGELPRRAKNIGELVLLHASGDYPNPCELRPEIPLRLGAVVTACLESEPANRCQSAQQVLDLLDSA